MPRLCKTYAPPANDAANISFSQSISAELFALLTKIPIVICCGDYISADNPHLVSQRWIERIHMAQAFADCVNRHFAFVEANNVEIADVLENWLVEKD